MYAPQNRRPFHIGKAQISDELLTPPSVAEQRRYTLATEARSQPTIEQTMLQSQSLVAN